MTFDTYRLSAGRHARPQQGRCAMEWVAHLAGEAHSDRPECVSLVVGAFARSFNDAAAAGAAHAERALVERARSAM